MKGLREKFRKNEGFTLVEMLIVVAIIAILIAVSIPLVTNALEKAREATDAANERAFKAELVICYLDPDAKTGGITFDSTKTYAYDAANGKLVESGASLEPYGQGRTGLGEDKEPSGEKRGMILWGKIKSDTEEVEMTWAEKANAPTTFVNNLTGPILMKKGSTTG